jgi:hypothetical protein
VRPQGRLIENKASQEVAFETCADGGPAEEDLRPWLVTVAEPAPEGVMNANWRD